MTRPLILSKGGRPRKNQSHDATGFDETRTLKQLGISKSQSSRWQMIAKLPEVVFERYLVECEARNKIPTTAGLVRLARLARGAKQMPGPSIGKEFNPMPELAWQGRITILKVGGEYTIKYDYENGDPRFDEMIRKRLDVLVKSLAR